MVAVMQTALPATGSDHRLAHQLAVAAGRLLLAIRSELVAGVSPDDVRSRGDRDSHELLLSRLRESAPGDGVLSEEGGGSGTLGVGRLWIVDPLDGTHEFGELNRRDWAVHVALVEGGELVAGAVALPARNVAYSTDAPPRPPHARAKGCLRVAVSRSRPAAEAGRVVRSLDGELVQMGSAGAKAMAVVSGDVDVYLHSGGQHVWDSAAPVAVARAAGLHASRLDGSALDYGSQSTWLPDLVICRRELRDRVLAAVQ